MQRRGFLFGLAASGGLATMARAAESPVVLELFTSQGCSSCPPADALLGELIRRPGVIALAWHVDYWNRLGWRDPYASRLATDRQRDYAARLQGEVFTPALVVNGSSIVIGSDRRAISQAVGRVAPLSVPVQLQRKAGRLVSTIGPAPAGATVLVASYDAERETAVGSGENGGRRLREYHIVRSASVLDPARERDLTEVPPDRGVVVLVQGPDLHILGATELPPA